MDGHIALYRKLLDNPIACKDADHLAVWIWLLLNASWKEHDVIWDNQRITLKPGQLPPTGRKVISQKLKISESKVQRILKSFENEHQIEQQTTNRNRLITIVSWDEYQYSEQLDEQQVNSKRTASEQQVNSKRTQQNKGNKGNTGNNGNNGNTYIAHKRNVIPPTLEMVDEYIREKGYNVDAEQFIDFYESKGWFVGKNKMKDWQAAVRTWEKSSDRSMPSRKSAANPFTEMLRKGEY